MQNLNGIFALANIRGGGEYGEEWHQAACKTKKQNCFDDFHAAGEFLVTEGYTTKERLAILGGSNGGLLVGACLNPEFEKTTLFNSYVLENKSLNMKIFNKFGEFLRFDELFMYFPLFFLNFFEFLGHPRKSKKIRKKALENS